MSRTKERIQNIILFFTDALCILGAYYLSGYLWLFFFKHFTEEHVMREMHDNVLTIVISYIVLLLFYTGDMNFTGRGKFEELKSVFKRNIVFACLIAICELLRKRDNDFPRGVYVITVVLAIVFMWLCHTLVKSILLKRSRGTNALQVIIITTRDRAERCLRGRNAREDWMRRLESVIVMDADADMVGSEIEGLPVVANGDNMLEYIRREVADEVYIDINYDNTESIRPIILALEEMGVTVNLKLDILEEFEGFDVTLGRMGGSTVATFAHRIYPYKKLAVKRGIDIIGGLVGIIIMGIAMIFVAPAIKLESPGPVFFKQKRVGKGGRYFYIYKFRSMYIDAEERKKELMAQNEMNGLMFKMDDDPRITKVGKFIRKTSIDELPQFINVLKGDMSLVGTRPPTVEEFKEYEGHHRRRLTMKPGITGMWQAYGRNTVLDFEDVVKMDVDYIDHWSLTLDIKILLHTIVTVFKDGGK